MDDNWFRHETWDEATRTDFEQRLGRARSGRSQYLRIQGSILTDSLSIADREAGRGLLRRVIEEYPDDVDVVLALEELGVSCASDGDFAGAREALRACLARCQQAGSTSGTSGVPELHLAEVLLASPDDANDITEACRLLAAAEHSQREGMGMFGETVFRFLRGCARAAALQDLDYAGAYARDALDVAEHGVPTFARYPQLGRASAEVDDLLELSALSARYPDGVLPDSVAAAFGVSGERLIDNQWDQQRRRRAALEQAAAEPVLQELREVGVTAESLWDLDELPAAARPILIAALSRTDLPDREREGAARMMGDRRFRANWGELVTVLRSLDPDSSRDTKEGLAAALSDLATRSNIDDVLDLLHDPGVGSNRIFFLSTLTRLRIPQRWQLISELRKDPQLQVQADHMLHQKQLRDQKRQANPST